MRRGSDIVKALALGAKAVLTGRATLYGTAVGGQAGAFKAISLIRNKFMDTPFVSAALQVMLGGALVFAAGILIGSS